MMRTRTRRTVLFTIALLVPTVFHRVVLSFVPHANFDVGSYNIHHLFTGVILMTLGGVPLAICRGRGRILDGATVIFGIGLSLALDEWVYLIATAGTDEDYLRPVSMWGAMVMLGIVSLYVWIIHILTAKRDVDHEKE